MQVSREQEVTKDRVFKGILIVSLIFGLVVYSTDPGGLYDLERDSENPKIQFDCFETL